MFSYPTVHMQQSSVPNGVAEHNVTVARAFTKLIGARRGLQDPLDSLLESQMQLGSLQYPHNRKGASEHFHFLRPCGYLRRRGAQHRHRPRGLPAPQLHCRLSHRARALGRPCPVHLQGPGRHDDGPVHPLVLPAGDALRHGLCWTKKKARCPS